MPQILDYLRTQEGEMLRTLARWVNQDSPTLHKASADAMGQMLVQAFTAEGCVLAATHPQPDFGDHYTLTFGSGSGQILLLCHFDTVWPLHEAQRRPFTVKNGVGRGPGSHDMKGGIVIALFALRALRALNLTPGKKITLLLTSDEEVSSPTSREIIEAAGRQSNVCFVLEGSHHRSRLTTSRKGVGRFTLNVTGKAAHAFAG
ncbi:MAG: M20/M25/M40 family metallo-hydrolase, partial [Chloroflexi bacterium]